MAEATKEKMGFVEWLGSADGKPHEGPRPKVDPEEIPEGERYIQRTSLQARLTHGFIVVSCVWLAISGLFVFIPPLASLVGADVVYFFRISHRAIGILFVLVPLISALLAPKGVRHIGFNLFHPWNKDDWIWLAKFVPYLLFCKKVHMPDQDYTKSGQRFADGMVWLCCLMMAVSGVGLVLGDVAFDWSAGVMMVWRFLHDLFFLLTVVFCLAHAYIGGGLFEPYKGCARIMWGDGKVSESDALYHWGKYARREIADGRNVYVEKGTRSEAQLEKDKAQVAEMAAHHAEHGKKAKK